MLGRLITLSITRLTVSADPSTQIHCAIDPTDGVSRCFCTVPSYLYFQAPPCFTTVTCDKQVVRVLNTKVQPMFANRIWAYTSGMRLGKWPASRPLGETAPCPHRPLPVSCLLFSPHDLILVPDHLPTIHARCLVRDCFHTRTLASPVSEYHVYWPLRRETHSCNKVEGILLRSRSLGQLFLMIAR